MQDIYSPRGVIIETVSDNSRLGQNLNQEVNVLTTNCVSRFHSVIHVEGS